jgi:hypothetical protein
MMWWCCPTKSCKLSTHFTNICPLHSLRGSAQVVANHSFLRAVSQNLANCQLTNTMSSTEPQMKKSSSLESYGTGPHLSITILKSKHVAQFTPTFGTEKWGTVAQYCLMHIECVLLLCITKLDTFCQWVLLSATFYFIWVNQYVFFKLWSSL